MFFCHRRRHRQSFALELKARTTISPLAILHLVVDAVLLFFSSLYICERRGRRGKMLLTSLSVDIFQRQSIDLPLHQNEYDLKTTIKTKRQITAHRKETRR